MAVAVDMDLASGDSYINILITGFLIIWLGTCMYNCHDSWHQIRWLVMWWVRWPVTDLFYVCLCLFTYVWSHVLFWKLYIVPMLWELTSLSLNINFNTLVTCPLSEADLVTGGPAYKLSPSLLLGSQFRLWGNQLLQQHWIIIFRFQIPLLSFWVWIVY